MPRAAAKPPKMRHNETKERKMFMENKLEFYWNDIPIGKQDAVTYADLMRIWGTGERQVRKLLHDLSTYDNGDNYVLIRSASGKGFYRTDNEATIKAYRQECLNKGKSVFAPVKKINRILNENASQIEFENNLRVYREAKGLKQGDVCKQMKRIDRAFDKSMLSKMENNVCLPTPFQAAKLADIYGCSVSELVNAEFYYS